MTHIPLWEVIVRALITIIIYDSGATGMAAIALSDMTGVVRGSTLKGDAIPNPVETVIVQEVHPPVVSTTIAAIQYDIGTSGLCTIQPTGSLSAGQIAMVPKPMGAHSRSVDGTGDPVIVVWVRQSRRVRYNSTIDFLVRA